MNTTLKTLSDKLDETYPGLVRLDTYWHGQQPAAFLAPASAEALGDRFRVLAVNFPRLAVEALGERLTITGFRTDGPDAEPDDELWRVWRRNGMEDASAQAHTDALVYGRSFVIVWADRAGNPVVTVESPRQVAVLRDPATRQVTAAMKRWIADGKGHAVLYEPDKITRLVSGRERRRPGRYAVDRLEHDRDDPQPARSRAGRPDRQQGTASRRRRGLRNGRRARPRGRPEQARRRPHGDQRVLRMAAPLGNGSGGRRGRRREPRQAVLSRARRRLAVRSTRTKFGQFDPARLDGYADAVALITQQIGALTGLPPHYLGLHGDQPTSADAIRSAEASLVARAYALHRTFGTAWADVARLVVAVRDGSDPLALDVETVWANPETRTPAQAADAAAKLVGVGVPLSVVLADTLGMTPAQVDRVRQARRGGRSRRRWSRPHRARVMTYRDNVTLIAAASETKVLAVFDRYEAGELDQDTTIALIAAIIAKANSKAVTLADLSLAATLMLAIRKPVPTLGLSPPADDPDRLVKAATTLLAVEHLTRERVARLARSEPLGRAADAYADGIRRSDHVTGWTRQVSANACELCQSLAGDVLPDSVPMYHHPGCTCTPVPVTKENAS